MIDQNGIPKESPLLDEKTRETIRGVFQKLNRDVTLKAALDVKEPKSAEMASFLKGIAALGAHVHLELYEADEAAAQLKEFMDIKRLPATGLFTGGTFTGAAFHGVPGGKEINSFVLGIYNAAGPGQELSKGAVKKIGKIRRPVHLKICVSLACHHCPGVVIACQRIAMLNPAVTAEMYDGGLYPDLVDAYHIERVPALIVNDSDVFLGPRSIEDLAQLCLDAR